MDEDEAPVEPFEPELEPKEPPALMVSASLVLDDADGAVYRSGADNRRAASLLTAAAGAVHRQACIISGAVWAVRRLRQVRDREARPVGSEPTPSLRRWLARAPSDAIRMQADAPTCTKA